MILILKMKISAEKLQTTRDFIFAVLHNTVIGERLPSIRDLIKKSNSSRTAVERVLEELEKQNLIKRISRSGIIRVDNAKGLIFDLIACHDGGYFRNKIPNFLNDVIDSIVSQADKKKYHLRMHSVGLNDSIEHYCRIASLEDSSGFLLIQPNMSELISLFKNTAKVVVIIFPEGSFTECDQIVTATSTISMQMQYLTELGHRRILYLRETYPDYHAMTLMFRRMEYYRLMAKYGLQIPRHWQSEYPPECISVALEKTFSMRPFPTALIIWDRDVKTVYDFLQARGLVVGKDVSVVATDGDMILADLKPSVTTVVSHAKQAAHNVWNMVEKQLNGDHNPQKIEVMLTFRHGLSVGMPPEEEK